jgi:hypothetical protein
MVSQKKNIKSLYFYFTVDGFKINYLLTIFTDNVGTGLHMFVGTHLCVIPLLQRHILILFKEWFQ